MSKPLYWRHWRVSVGLRVAAVVMIIAGVAARAAGASLAVFFAFGGLMLACLVLSLFFARAFFRGLRQDNYGVRLRSGDPYRDQRAGEAAGIAQARTASRGSWKQLGLLVLALVLFWPAVFAIAIVATSANPSTSEWAVAVLLPLLFVWSATDWMRVRLAERRPRY